MFDLMTMRDNLSHRHEIFLGRWQLEEDFSLLRGSQIYLPTIDDNTLKIFHLISLDSKVKNHLKSHWKFW